MPSQDWRGDAMDAFIRLAKIRAVSLRDHALAFRQQICVARDRAIRRAHELQATGQFGPFRFGRCKQFRPN